MFKHVNVISSRQITLDKLFQIYECSFNRRFPYDSLTSCYIMVYKAHHVQNVQNVWMLQIIMTKGRTNILSEIYPSNRNKIKNICIWKRFSTLWGVMSVHKRSGQRYSWNSLSPRLTVIDSTFLWNTLTAFSCFFNKQTTYSTEYFSEFYCKCVSWYFVNNSALH